MVYLNISALALVLAVGVTGIRGTQHSEPNEDSHSHIHRRQVGAGLPAQPPLSTTANPLIAGAAVTPPASSVSVAAPGVAAISTLPTARPGTAATSTPGVAAASLSPSKPASNAVSALPLLASTTPPHLSTLASSASAKPAQLTTPTPAPAAVPTATLTTKGGGAIVVGGGGGSPQTGPPGSANIITATMGSGGILEYGSCMTFESQCNELCSYGIYSMNCVSGGLCLCYGDDSTDIATESPVLGNALSGSVTGTSHAARQLSARGVSILVLPVFAVLIATAAFF
ncbi:hypothetical protein GGI04_002723 [Coemansia thaxteri]|nr:hypothetical protein GGI04_002723 [Coemansia thaxteri]